MKTLKLLYLLSFSVTAILSHAQGTTTGQSTNHRPPLRTVKSLEALDERLIATAYYPFSDSVFILNDSTYQWYSGVRNLNPFGYSEYDSLHDYRYSTVAGAYQLFYYDVQTFDSRNNPVTLIRKVVNDADSFKAIQAYDANNNLINGISQNWNTATNTWLNTTQEIYSYDSTTGNILSEIDQNWDSTSNSWTNTDQYIYSYDAHNNNVLTVYQTWSNPSWINNSQYFHTFSSSNNIISQIDQSWNTISSTWSTFTYDTVIYDANSNVASITYQSVSGSTSVNQQQYLFTYDANHNQLSQIYQQWDVANSVWKNSSRILNTYDSYNNVTFYISNTWISGAWLYSNNDYMRYYYYELYNTDGVAPINAPKGNLAIYPSPAGTLLNIDLTWNEPQAATVGIYDASGRLWRQWSIPSGMSYQSNISVSQLPAGTYYMSVKGQTSNAIKSFSVLH